MTRMARTEAALTISAAKRGRRIENCITCVYGFAQGSLPEHLTDQFAAKEGEEAFGMVMRLEKGGSLSDNMYKTADFYSMTDKVRILLPRPCLAPTYVALSNAGRLLLHDRQGPYHAGHPYIGPVKALSRPYLGPI